MLPTEAVSKQIRLNYSPVTCFKRVHKSLPLPLLIPHAQSSMWKIQGDQKVSVHLTITVQNNTHKTDELKMVTTEYIRNVDRAILNTVFENTVRRANKCLETSGGHFEHYL